jgi:hypothetical protein
MRSPRRRAVLIAASVAILAAAAALYWFAPQSALMSHRLDEPAPTGAAATRAPAAPAAGPLPSRGGELTSLEHHTTGRARLLDTGPGGLVLRLEDLDTLEGPDVHVYLSPAEAGSDPAHLGDGGLDLGPLRANQGSANYAVPAGTDSARYRSAVIWCKRFSVAFGVAPLA